jgi:hypothetical protein
LLMLVSVSAITTGWLGGMSSATWIGSIVNNQKQNF